MLASSLANVNLVLHTPGAILSAAWVEATCGNFSFYVDGMTPGVVRSIEALDRERLAVAAAFGHDLPPLIEEMAAIGTAALAPVGRGDLRAAITEGEANRSIRAPDSLAHRYYAEDFGFGLVPMIVLAQIAGVETPYAEALVEMASVLSGDGRSRERSWRRAPRNCWTRPGRVTRPRAWRRLVSIVGVRIAVVGGDEREQEIARLAALEGAEVTAYGFPWPEAGISGVRLAETAGAAVRAARFALFPIPGIATDGALFAPAAPMDIVPTAELLSLLETPGHVILGAADDRLRAAASATGVTLHEYEHDAELMLLRGPAIVEGALAMAIANTEVTIHSAKVCVVGHGTIGSLFARTLVLLGARVTVAARNPVQRAAARAAGADAIPLEELADLAPDLAMIFSTVPAPVVGRPVLERMPRGSLVMDLAAPPGGADLDAAQDLGHVAVWARGLGRRAPVTVGASQWGGIRTRIEQIEKERREG